MLQHNNAIFDELAIERALADWYHEQKGLNPDWLGALTKAWAKLEPGNSNAPVMYNDARVIGHFDPRDYAGLKIKVSVGKDAEDKRWITRDLDFLDLLNYATVHKKGQKNGPAVVYADIVPGRRLGKSVIECTAIAVDVDTGLPTDEAMAIATRTGCFFVHHTTHSHGCTRSDFSKDEVLKYRTDVDVVDTEVMRDYLLNKKKWDPRIVETVEYAGQDQNEKGVVVEVTHEPMPKHRFIFFLKVPFVIREEARLQTQAMEKWKTIYKAFCSTTGFPFDVTCADPARLLYLPRHAEGRPFEINLHVGPFLDWRPYAVTDPFDAFANESNKGKSASVTDAGRKLGKFWHTHQCGFQIMDVIEAFAPDKIRSKASLGYNICGHHRSYIGRTIP